MAGCAGSTTGAIRTRSAAAATADAWLVVTPGPHPPKSSKSDWLDTVWSLPVAPARAGGRAARLREDGVVDGEGRRCGAGVLWRRPCRGAAKPYRLARSTFTDAS